MPQKHQKWLNKGTSKQKHRNNNCPQWSSYSRY